MTSFGISLTLYRDRPLAATIGDYARLCRLAEEAGFESAWLGESHLQGPGALTAAPFLVHAALAAETRLRLGAVTLAPLWHPLKLAYTTAVLDQLCDGRLTLLVGVGPTATVTDRYGVPYEELGRRTDELLATVRSLWRDGPIWPRPVQPGGPTLFVGGGLRRSVRRAAELGDGWYGASIYLLDEYARLAAAYRKELARLGRDPAAALIGCNRTLVLGEDEEEIRREARPYVETIHRYYAQLGYLRTPAGELLGPEDDLFEPFGDELFFIGAPERVAAAIRRYLDIGVTHFHFRISPGGLSREYAARTIELFGSRVRPLLTARPPDVSLSPL